MEDVLITSHPAPIRKNPPVAASADEEFPDDEEDLFAEEVEDTGGEEQEEDELPYQPYSFEDDAEGRAIEEEDRSHEPWRFSPPSGTKSKPGREEQITFPFEESEGEVPFLQSEEEDEEEEADFGSPISWMDKVLPIQEKSRPAPNRSTQEEDDWLSGIRDAGVEQPPPASEGPRILRKGSAPAEISPEPAPRTQQVDREVARRHTERKPLFREVSSTARNSSAPVQTALSDVPIPESSIQRWKSVYIIAIPLIAALIGLAVLSVGTISDPSLLNDLVSTTLKAGPSSPPPGLFISEVQFKDLELENGNRLPAITGKVTNRTDRIFNEVVIIGGLFDKKGAPMVEAKTNLSSPLHRSRLKSLSIEMLPKLMTEGSSRSFKLKPGEESLFVLPFSEETTGGMKIKKAPAHFAAKVFSVE